MMFADLHIHTHYSDSKHSPSEVVALAKKQGINLISICDHNVTSAYDELIPLCKSEGISLIVGAEISSIYDGREYHILAFGFDMENKEIKNLLEYGNSMYTDRGIQLIKNIDTDYTSVSLLEFLTYERNRQNGGWASIDYLIHKGLIDGLDGYFDFCRKYGADDKNKFKSIADVVKIIHNAGGKAIFAHAGEVIDNTQNIFKAKLPELLKQGVDGFECYYTSHTTEITEILVLQGK